jgi:hypothetical protein
MASTSQSPDEDMIDSEMLDEEQLVRKPLRTSLGGVSNASSVQDTKLPNGTSWRKESDAEYKISDSGSFGGNGTMMTTGCIPCLILGVPCDPSNPGCRLQLSSDWSINEHEPNSADGSAEHSMSPSLSMVRLDSKWQHNWRERHSLNFFVNYSAPQMAGFFENDFWSRCIQYSYYEPVVLHAITAIGSLHESILQGAFQDEKRMAQAVEFALTQCNRSIAYLTGSNKAAPEQGESRSCKALPVSKLALIACVLFTCFESMQGHSDSAIKHALQGKALMESHHTPSHGTRSSEEEDIELMRPLVERLEVQATALVGSGGRHMTDETSSVPPLPAIDKIYNLDHAHATLHSAMNSNMRYTQRVPSDAPADHHAIIHAKKSLRYGPWYARWEEVFSIWLAAQGGGLSNLDRKRAMVLKANQLVGTMLAAADQRAGPTAYHRFDNEFAAIVELSREVLADFPSPPLPSLTAGSARTPYFSCSLWVTDPLWMVISRCKNPETRQAAFTLLSQNPRQEGVWHSGPKTSNDGIPKGGTGSTSQDSTSPKGTSPSSSNSKTSTPGSGSTEVSLGEVPEAVSHSESAGNMRARSDWVDLMASSQLQDSGSDDVGG